MASSMPISLPIPLQRRRIPKLPRRRLPLSFSVSTSVVCLSTKNSSGYDREEGRWLREEQRWLREEQRWILEEKRWLSERETLLREISDLKLRLQAPEYRSSRQGASASVTISAIGTLLQVLKEKNQVSENGLSTTTIVLEERMEEREEVEKRVIAPDGIRASEGVKKRRTLKTGSEGDEVREMQEALLKLGFYSGEEDMEYSSFSSGTDTAVKTWQASMGVPEDGIMTAELLHRLFMGELTSKVESGEITDKLEETITRQKSIIKGEGGGDVEVSRHRVFLLGENRWEDPSRLVGRNIESNGRQPADSKAGCVTCRGEGQMMCTECDGTGEPNLEPQFMEWIDEGTRCPYCQGLGYTVCDGCQGKITV